MWAYRAVRLFRLLKLSGRVVRELDVMSKIAKFDRLPISGPRVVKLL